MAPEKQYLAAFRVLCMGDTTGVDIAQGTHEALLAKIGCVTPNETLVYGQLFLASNTLEGLYIDDHLTFQVLDKRPRGRYRDEDVTDRARARYAELKLPRSEKKFFDKAYSFKAWGTEVDSQSGRVSAPLEKLRQIAKQVRKPYKS